MTIITDLNLDNAAHILVNGLVDFFYRSTVADTRLQQLALVFINYSMNLINMITCNIDSKCSCTSTS